MYSSRVNGQIVKNSWECVEFPNSLARVIIVIKSEHILALEGDRPPRKPWSLSLPGITDLLKLLLDHISGADKHVHYSWFRSNAAKLFLLGSENRIKV